MYSINLKTFIILVLQYLDIYKNNLVIFGNILLQVISVNKLVAGISLVIILQIRHVAAPKCATCPQYSTASSFLGSPVSFPSFNLHNSQSLSLKYRLSQFLPILSTLISPFPPLSSSVFIFYSPAAIVLLSSRNRLAVSDDELHPALDVRLQWVYYLLSDTSVYMYVYDFTFLIRLLVGGFV